MAQTLAVAPVVAVEAALFPDLPWPEDDTEESVMGADWHQLAMFHAFGPLKEYADERAASGLPPWYVSSEVTVQIALPTRLWSPKPDLFVVPAVSGHGRSSYDTRTEGPVPPFVLEVASESTWRNDVGPKRTWYGVSGVREYLVFDPTQAYLREPLAGWHATPDGWASWEPTYRDDGTMVWESAVLGLAVRPEGSLLRFDHPVLGPLPLLGEVRARLAEERRRLAEREQMLAEREQMLAEREQMLAEERRRRADLQEELRLLRGGSAPSPDGD